ncbi:MAG: hypothetical protein AB7T63_14560 [Planctomycetota bacterium]
MDPDAAPARRSLVPWIVGALLVVVGVFVAVSRHAPPAGRGATTALERPKAGPAPATPFVPAGLPVHVVVPVDAAGQPYAGTVYALEAGGPGVDEPEVVPEVLVTGAREATLRVPFAGRYDIGFVPLEHAWSVLAGDVDIGAGDAPSVALQRPDRLAPLRLAALDGAWPDDALAVTVLAGDDGRPGRRRLPGRGEQRTFTVKLGGWRGAFRQFCERPIGEPTVVGLRVDAPASGSGDASPAWVPFAPRTFVTIDPLLVVSWVRAATLDVHIAVPDVHATARVVVHLRGPDDDPKRQTLDVRPGDADRRFVRFAGLVPGPYVARAFGDGLEEQRQEIVLEPGTVRRLLFAVPPAEAPEGASRGDEAEARLLPLAVRGLPAGFEGVYGAYGADPARSDDLVGREAAATGTHEGPRALEVRLYNADGSGPFQAYVYAVPDAASGESRAAGPVELAVGARAEVELVPAGYVVPLVRLEGVTSSGSAPLRLVHADGVPLPVLTPEGVVVRAAVLAGGHPRIGPLPPGPVRFEVRVGRWRVGTVEVEVAAGEVRRFEVP